MFLFGVYISPFILYSGVGCTTAIVFTLSSFSIDSIHDRLDETRGPNF